METSNSITNKDAHDDVRTVVLAGISAAIPKVGGVVSALVGVYWPENGVDYWEQVKKQVEALIDEKISKAVFQQVQEALQGLQNSTNLYLDRVKDSEHAPENIYTQAAITLNSFAEAYPRFQSKGYEVLLLPLYAQMMNLYLSVQRDMVIFGAEWKATPEEVATRKKDLIKLIDEGVAYCDKWIEKGREQAGLRAFDDIKNVNHWQNYNAYMRGMTFSVLDHSFFWSYFNQDNGNPPLQTREIYSDRSFHQDHTEGNRLTLPTGTLMGVLTRVRTFARSDNWIYGIELTYDDADTVLLGIKESPNHELKVKMNAQPTLANPITKVDIGAKPGSISYIKLTFRDGSSRSSGGYERFIDNSTFSFTHQHVSSIRALETRDFGAVGSITFGFRFSDSFEGA